MTAFDLAKAVNQDVTHDLRNMYIILLMVSFDVIGLQFYVESVFATHDEYKTF